jgi:hypothetical protein
MLDLKDYASLVVDIAPDERSPIFLLGNGVSIQMNNVKLIGSAKEPMKKP